MFAIERQQAILVECRTRGRVDVAKLSDQFGFSAETIRRDLAHLEEAGHLRRTHGGAVSTDVGSPEQRFDARQNIQMAQKNRIAQAALDFVPDSGSILLDSGTTTERLAESLSRNTALTVVTNSLPVVMRLVELPLVTVMTVGGRVRCTTLAEVDEWALRTLSEVRVDVAFLGANAVSINRGLSTPDPSEARIKQKMLEVSVRRVLLCDSHKLGKEGLVNYAPLKAVDVLITDTGCPVEFAAAAKGCGVEVVIV